MFACVRGCFVGVEAERGSERGRQGERGGEGREVERCAFVLARSARTILENVSAPVPHGVFVSVCKCASAASQLAVVPESVLFGLLMCQRFSIKCRL